MIQEIINKFVDLEILNRTSFKLFSILRLVMLWGGIPIALIATLMFLDLGTGLSILVILGGWFTVAYVIGHLSSAFFGVLFLVLVFGLMIVIELKLLYLKDTLEKYTEIVTMIYNNEEEKFNEIANEQIPKTNIPIIKRSIN